MDVLRWLETFVKCFLFAMKEQYTKDLWFSLWTVAGVLFQLCLRSRPTHCGEKGQIHGKLLPVHKIAHDKTEYRGASWFSEGYQSYTDCDFVYYRSKTVISYEILILRFWIILWEIIQLSEFFLKFFAIFYPLWVSGFIISFVQIFVPSCSFSWTFKSKVIYVRSFDLFVDTDLPSCC